MNIGRRRRSVIVGVKEAEAEAVVAVMDSFRWERRFLVGLKEV